MYHGRGDERRCSHNIINDCKMAFTLHVLDRLSDECVRYKY